MFAVNIDTNDLRVRSTVQLQQCYQCADCYHRIVFTVHMQAAQKQADAQAAAAAAATAAHAAAMAQAVRLSASALMRIRRVSSCILWFVAVLLVLLILTICAAVIALHFGMHCTDRRSYSNMRDDIALRTSCTLHTRAACNSILQYCVCITCYMNIAYLSLCICA
jgi:ABC-type uncharacterized transport system permease subunit